MKKIFYLFLFVLLIIGTKVQAYKEYKIGDEITYKDINFYVINDSKIDDNYIVLLKSDALKKQELDDLSESLEINGEIHYDDDYIHTLYYSADDCISAGDISGCSVDYSLSYVKQIVDLWVNKTINLDDLTKDSTGYSSRIMTKDEYANISKKELYQENDTSEPFDLYTPFYDWQNIEQEYWTMTPYLDYNESTYCVSIMGNLINCKVYSNKDTIRPVIVLKKEAIGDYNVTNNTVEVSNTSSKFSIIFIIIGLIIIGASGITIFKMLSNKVGK